LIGETIFFSKSQIDFPLFFKKTHELAVSRGKSGKKDAGKKVRNLLEVTVAACGWLDMASRLLEKGFCSRLSDWGNLFAYQLPLSAHVGLVLTGPKNRRQLQENLHHLRKKGPLSAEEIRWFREFGQVVHTASSRFTFRF
jgi:hypothetical protein